MGDAPAHEDERDVGVVGAGRAVVGAVAAAAGIVARQGYGIELAAALGVVAPYEALLERLGYRGSSHVVEVDHAGDTLLRLKALHGSRHHGLPVETVAGNGLVVDIDAVLVDLGNETVDAKLRLECTVHGLDHAPHVELPAGQLVGR